LVQKLQKKLLQNVFLKKVGSTGTRKRCCRFLRTCFNDNNKKKKNNNKCTEKLFNIKPCFWVGFTFHRRTIRKCHRKKYGPNSIRNRCCSWKTECKIGSCVRTNLKCKWTGAIIRKIRTVNCNWKQKNKFQRQRRCCSLFKTCVGKRCHSKRGVLVYVQI